IIEPIESQRNAGNLASFGIKNAGRTAGEHKFVIGGGVDEGLAFGPAAGLFNHLVALSDYPIQLSWGCKWLITMGLVSRLEVDIHFVGGCGEGAASGDYASLIVSSALWIGIGKAFRTNGDGVVLA